MLAKRVSACPVWVNLMMFCHHKLFVIDDNLQYYYHVSGDNVMITPASKIVQPGGNVTIECRQKAGLPNGAYAWNVILTNQSSALAILSGNDEHYHYPQNSMLMILNITTEYAGEYFCEWITQTDSCISNKSAITIYGKLLSSLHVYYV